MASPFTLGQHVAPARFVGFGVVSLVAGLLALRSAGWAEATLIGFDIGAATFLLSCVPLIGHRPDVMRVTAERNDANRAMLLGITTIVCAVVLVAIGVELSARETLQPSAVALIIATLLLAWLFSNMVYTLHYAHLFYSRDEGGGDAGGIAFPDETEPDYWDFIYFAFTLGMTFQTSDVAITRRPVRRVAIVHCFAAFVFNIGVLAFTINILGS